MSDEQERDDNPQRFSAPEDLNTARCTIEEREEYEPHLDAGHVVYAGVDYEAILRQAEQEADVILWDGGNNDFPFYRPDLFVVVADPLRPGHEHRFHPGETNVRMADVLVLNHYGRDMVNSLTQAVQFGLRDKQVNGKDFVVIVPLYSRLMAQGAGEAVHAEPRIARRSAATCGDRI